MKQIRLQISLGVLGLAIAGPALAAPQAGDEDQKDRLLIEWPEPGEDGVEQDRDQGAMPAFPVLPQGVMSGNDPEQWEAWNAEVQEWQEQFHEWRESTMGHQMGGGFSHDWDDFAHSLHPPRPGEGSVHQEHKSVEMRVDGDGRVTVNIERDENGQRVEETYEADSLDEFTREYPEVAGDLGIGTGVGMGMGRLRAFAIPGAGMRTGGPARLGQRFRNQPPVPGMPPVSPDRSILESQPSFGMTVQDDGPKLGVYIEQIDGDSALRRHLGLEDGVGLLITGVVDDSLADRLGIGRNSVNQAYRALAEDGVARAHVGQGTRRPPMCAPPCPNWKTVMPSKSP